MGVEVRQDRLDGCHLRLDSRIGVTFDSSAQFLTNLDRPARFLNDFGYYGSFDWRGIFAVTQ
jgi:hypothetical protein